MSNSSAGFIDTNVLIHALTTDDQGLECRALLEEVAAGTRDIVLTTMVAHEFTYAVRRYAKQMTREDIGDYLVSLMSLPSVHVEDDYLFDTVRVWASRPDLGFVDAYLAIRAEREHQPIYTKNLRHFQDFDVEIPNPLTSVS